MSGAEIVGLFASGTQFAIYAFKLLKAARDAHNSACGLTDELKQIDAISASALSTLKEFRQSLGKEDALIDEHGIREEEGEEERADRLLRLEGMRLVSELQEKLESLKLPIDDREPNRRFSTKKARDRSSKWIAKARKALRTAWQEKEIRELEARLQAIMGAVSARSIADMRSKHYRSFEKFGSDVNTIRNGLDVLKRVLESKNPHNPVASEDIGTNDLATNLDRIIEITSDYDYERAILGSLHYPSLEERWKRVVKSHSGTCGWIYDDPRTCFQNWLEEHGGVYWIHGKPGSGKSTLMKHIFSSDRTDMALRVWSGSGKSLVHVRHFFWISGKDPLDRSQHGLYRSLLFQIFSSQPSLILPTCKPLPGNISTWGTEDFKTVFDNIRKCIATGTPAVLKLALFIDGMDEYDTRTAVSGHSLDIVEVLRSLAQCDNIKVCVSSRPWAVFRNEFGDTQFQTEVHRFTFQDMLQFSHDRLSQFKAFRNAQAFDERWTTLPEYIAKKAEGVWLWTFLVSKDVLGKVAENESYDTVKSLLEDTPPDLYDYFQELVERSNEQYRGEGARILLIALHQTFQLGGLGFALLLQHPRDLLTRIRAKDARLELLPEYSSLSTLKDRLSNRCRDLLEFGAPESIPWKFPHGKQPSGSIDSYEVERFGKILELESHKIDFIHRTVRDFLKDKFMAELRIFAGEDFEAEICILSVPWAITKMTPRFPSGDYGTFGPIRQVYYKFLQVALEIDKGLQNKDRVGQIGVSRSLRQSYAAVIQSIDADEALSSALFDIIVDTGPQKCPATFSFLPTLQAALEDPSFRDFLSEDRTFTVSVLVGLRFYVRERLRLWRDSKPTSTSRSMLSALMLLVLSPLNFPPMLDRNSDWHAPEENRHELNPEDGMGRISATGASHSSLTSDLTKENGEPGVKVDLEMVSLLLRLGADPNARLPPFGITPWTSHLLCHLLCEYGCDETGTYSHKWNVKEHLPVFHKEIGEEVATFLVKAAQAHYPPSLPRRFVRIRANRTETDAQAFEAAPMEVIRSIYGQVFVEAMQQSTHKSTYVRGSRKNTSRQEQGLSSQPRNPRLHGRNWILSRAMRKIFSGSKYLPILFYTDRVDIKTYSRN
ncbi:hypothetical protein BJ508DRAFT_40 [Ascobolus immersus RN42]|uniref:Uncharacterized protein n=1 Tax=Ascobolus immersus RN42 TaxID=1160509 RepID=A0A3N4IUE7_ASCIM|nr:hypothetical protein BJ508DRAFT_40 [Ascobolus immersus RN42]